jgi:hypothetical protein
MRRRECGFAPPFGDKQSPRRHLHNFRNYLSSTFHVQLSICDR